MIVSILRAVVIFGDYLLFLNGPDVINSVIHSNLQFTIILLGRMFATPGVDCRSDTSLV